MIKNSVVGIDCLKGLYYIELFKNNLLVLNISLGPENSKIRNHLNEYADLEDFAKNFILNYNESKVLTSSHKEKIKKVLDSNIHRTHLKWMDSVSAEIVAFCDNEYPDKLREIQDYPVLIYTNSSNKIRKTKNSITVIGSRKATGYGKWAAEKITGELVCKNFGIISGLAAGIDTIAHRSALKNKGFTAAILPCGLDVIYPSSNKELYREIWEKGLIVTEFPLGTRAYPYNFEFRNRLMSALGDGVLVIEASEKSGTMLTCNHAAEQGKEVYAVPGNIDSYYSRGTNRLISEGAKIVTSACDIFEDYKNCGNETMTDYSILSDDEKNIIELLLEGEKNIHELCEKLNADICSLYNILTMLELNGYIIQGKGKVYRLNII